MNIQHQEEADFHHSTDSEWDAAEANELGAANPANAWVCTDRDVWHKNPFYTGPAVPHPEDYDPCDEDQDFEVEPVSATGDDDDDIPF